MINLINLTQMEYNYYNDYNNYNILENLDNMLEEFTNGTYDKDDYICDIISYIAEDYTPIYNNQIWGEAAEIYEHVEEAIEEVGGLIEGNLVRTFQYGIQRYNELGLYSNLEELKFNIAIEYLDTIYKDESTDTQYILKQLKNEDIINKIKGLDVDNKIAHIYEAIEKMVGDLRC